MDAHRAAYLTGVLAVFAFAALAATVDVWQKRRRLGWRKPFRVPPLFLLASCVFAGSLLWVVCERARRRGRSRPRSSAGAGRVDRQPGVAVHRVPVRRVRVRRQGDRVRVGRGSRRPTIPILVPLRPGQEAILERRRSRSARGTAFRARCRSCSCMAELADPSDFHHRPLVRIARENGRVVIHITRCCSIPHALAAAALEVASQGGVPEVHFGWSAENPVTANLHFVLFGTGNVPWMVYTLIRRADVPEDRKPRVVVA